MKTSKFTQQEKSALSDSLLAIKCQNKELAATSQGGGLPKIGIKGIFYPGSRVNVANSCVKPFRKGGLSEAYVTH